DAGVAAPLDGILSFPAGTPIRPGTRVRAGDTLAFIAPTLDPAAQADLLVQRREAEAEARKARTALRVAKADWERARQLQRVLSERERQEIEAAYEAAQADLAAAEQIQGVFAGRERSGDRIAVRSPITGVVAEVLATAGTAVPQGERLFRVIDLGRLWIEGAAYENQLAALGRAGDGQVEVPALRRRLPAKLISRGFAIDPATRTAPIYFDVDDPSGLLLPEMSVKVYVPSGEPEVTLTVPRAALVETEGRKVLFVHPAPEEFRAREVETGWEDAGQVEIVRGVQEGERVVVQGLYELRSAAGIR
ncbi:MAG TPA: efflux RND transporter periplasmic adaptor subunit, partial [Thermoanaerobaculia bacterium]|nr:efflux RND transporter periplasmic adaptor subunit [Thermoanaerobaculia bacterium]